MKPMHELERKQVAASEDEEGRDRITQGSAPVTFLRREAAGNDAKGPGPAAPSPPTKHELDHAARTRRAQAFAEHFWAGLSSILAFARKVRQQYRHHRDAVAIRDRLSELDDRSLRDLGLDRSEITSVAAEASGQAEISRVRTLLQHTY